MSEEKDVKWSMAVNGLIADWMMFVNAYKRQEGRLRFIQLIVSPFGRTEKVFYSEEPMLHYAFVPCIISTVKNRCYTMEKCKKSVRRLDLM